MNFADANFFCKIIQYFSPVFKMFFPLLFFDKIFDFHLFKFTCAKNEVTRRNFISKDFANLADTERQLGMVRVYDIFEVNENTLGGFCAQMRGGNFFSSADLNFKKFIAKISDMS